MEDQLKVIKEDVLYTSNEVDQMLQVIERFNQRLFSMEARLKAVEEGLRIDASKRSISSGVSILEA